MKILVVDDSMITRAMLRECIEKSGNELIGEANDGEEGISKYKELKPDLILLDITMPKMDGIECLEILKKYDKDVKVIICSSIGQDSVIEKAMELGALDYIVKPFEDENVIKKLKKYRDKIK